MAFSIPQVIIGSKEERLKALAERRVNAPEKIDNASLYAESPMYFYCVSCGHGAAKLPENYITPPSSLCPECAALKVMAWLE